MTTFHRRVTLTDPLAFAHWRDPSDVSRRRNLRSITRASAGNADFGDLLAANAGAWAFTFHGLTEQQQVSALDAFVTKRRPARRLTAARLVFHPIAATLVKYGTAETTIESVTVRVSDLERTLLDALDHPDVVGSVDRAVNLVIRALPRADRFFRGLGPSCRSERTGARWHDKVCRRARISGRTAPLTVSQAARFCALRSPLA